MLLMPGLPGLDGGPLRPTVLEQLRQTQLALSFLLVSALPSALSLQGLCGL